MAANDPACRVPVQMSFVCNRVGFAALLALAIYELPNPGDKLTDDADRLCEFLRRQLRTDGSVHYTDGPNDVPPQIDPAGVNEYPGLALQALAVSNRVRPAEWKKDAVKNGVAHYAAHFRAKPHPLLAATVIPAATELFLQTKLNEAATATAEMADWLCALQITHTDSRNPQWAGGFRGFAGGQATDAAAGIGRNRAVRAGLACAYQVARQTADLTREAQVPCRGVGRDAVPLRAAVRGGEHPALRGHVPRGRADRRVPSLPHRRQPAHRRDRLRRDRPAPLPIVRGRTGAVNSGQ